MSFILGPPYDSIENDDYAQNQRNGYNYRNPSNDGGNGYGDNVRFPPNDNNLHNVRPQVNKTKI